MKIADGLEVLELKKEMNGQVRFFNAVLIWDKKDMILVDAGLPGMFDEIELAIKNAGTYFERLNKIIITHHDMDHIGSLATVVKNSKRKIEVISHIDEMPYINGEKMSLKMTPERLNALPKEKKSKMKAQFSAMKTEVDSEVQDGEILPYCGGITIIHTPGHTLGHICLYLHKYKALITGDALNIEAGQLIGPKPEFTYDMETAVKSLKKLLSFDIETLICYHGGIYKDNAMDKVSELCK